VCPTCKAGVNPGARFCKNCGAALGASTAGGAPKRSDDSQIQIADTSAAENIEGERKTVTALFADIKGSTELMEDLDPEEARAIVDPALKLMIEAVRRYGGYVVQSTGDGIFALFGAPVAHSATGALCGVAIAGGAETVFSQSAGRGRNAYSGPRRDQHRRSRGPLDPDRRGPGRVHADRTHHQPRRADAEPPPPSDR